MAICNYVHRGKYYAICDYVLYVQCVGIVRCQQNVVICMCYARYAHVYSHIFGHKIVTSHFALCFFALPGAILSIFF